MKWLPSVPALIAFTLSVRGSSAESTNRGGEYDPNTILPELVVKGSTSGESTAAVGLGMWLPIPSPTDGADPTERRRLVTSVLDLRAATKDGLGTLLKGSTDADPAFSAPVTWSVGFSLGLMASNSADDLYGRSPYAPSAEMVLDANAAIQRCKFVCKNDPVNNAGCEGFKDYEEEMRAAGRYEWLESNILTAHVSGAADIIARIQSTVPSSLPGCVKAKAEIETVVRDYVLAPENKRSYLAESVASLVTSCHAECGASPAPSAACRSVSSSALSLEDSTRYDASSPPDPENDLCAAGQPLYKGDPSQRIRAARYQRWRVSVGGALGFTPQKYLRQAVASGTPVVVDLVDENGNPTGATQPRLEEHAETSVSGNLGLAAGVLPLSGMTLEGRFLYTRSATAASTKAEWCETKGIVGPASDDPAAESCTTRALKAPTIGHTLAIDAYVGHADLERGVYRASIGPRWLYENTPHDGAHAKHSIGLRIPVALNLLAAPRNEGKLDYDGLIRITPYFDAVLQSGENTVYQGGVSLELLGKRSLFSTKYDEL